MWKKFLYTRWLKNTDFWGKFLYFFLSFLVKIVYRVNKKPRRWPVFKFDFMLFFLLFLKVIASCWFLQIMISYHSKTLSSYNY